MAVGADRNEVKPTALVAVAVLTAHGLVAVDEVLEAHGLVAVDEVLAVVVTNV